MSVRGPWRIKGDNRPLRVRVCDRTEEDASESERGIGEQAPTVRQGRDRMEGAIDQPIRINEEKAFRLHDRSVAQEERRAGGAVVRSSARGGLGVATATGALDEQEAEEKDSAARNHEPGEISLFRNGIGRLKRLGRLFVCGRHHCRSFR